MAKMKFPSATEAAGGKQVEVGESVAEPEADPIESAAVKEIEGMEETASQKLMKWDASDDVALEAEFGEGDPDEDEEENDEAEEESQPAEDDDADEDSWEQDVVPDVVLVEEAVRLGFSLSEANSMTDAALKGVIRVLKGKAETEEVKDEKESEEEAEYDTGLDPEEYEPALIDAMKKLHSEHQKEIRGLESRIDQLMQAESARVQTGIEQQLDAAFDGLGEEWQDTFGSGKISGLGEKSAELRNRVKVIEEMDALASGYEARGREVPEVEELFNRARRSVFGIAEENHVAQNVSRKVKKRAKSIVSRPTSRNGRATGERAAFERSAKFDKQFDAEIGSLATSE